MANQRAAQQFDNLAHSTIESANLPILMCICLYSVPIDMLLKEHDRAMKFLVYPLSFDIFQLFYRFLYLYHISQSAHYSFLF